MRNYNANIMLDLECIAVEAPNAALIELGATYFDLDTGVELGSLKTPISLQSCLDLGLASDDETVKWVTQNIPETLATSKTTQVTLQNALFKLSNFIRNAVTDMREKLLARGQNAGLCQPMIWGNGAVADNVWIKSAYAACGMKRPWMFYEDMCVRTFVKQVGLITGRNFPGEVARTGKHHDALEDCRHQVKFLVLARNALMSINGPALEPVTPGKQLIHEISTPQTEPAPQRVLSAPLAAPQTQPKQRLISELLRPGSIPSKEPEVPVGQIPPRSGNIATRLTLPIPETSFSEEDQGLDIEKTQSSPPKRKRVPVKNAAVQRPGMLPTPDTSFSSADGEIEDIPGLASRSLTHDEEGFLSFMTGIGRATEAKGILSPETSFSRLDNENEVDEPPSPSPNPKRLSPSIVKILNKVLYAPLVQDEG